MCNWCLCCNHVFHPFYPAPPGAVGLDPGLEGAEVLPGSPHAPPVQRVLPFVAAVARGKTEEIAICHVFHVHLRPNGTLDHVRPASIRTACGIKLNCCDC